MKQEFELVAHEETNINLFLNRLLYRTPHFHRDFEFGCVLSGDVSFALQKMALVLHTGDFYMLNPFESHEILAKEPVLLLTVEFPSSFFSSYYPDIVNLVFDTHVLRKEDREKLSPSLLPTLIDMAYSYFEKKDFYSIRCSMDLDRCFLILLNDLEYHFVKNEEHTELIERKMRLKNISEYIDEHSGEKLLLSDIAERENLSLYYLSHLFKKEFGLPFQEYLMRERCEKARLLLLRTDLSLLDISISCGFSDPKYLNKGFYKQYRCTPKEYRHRVHDDDLPRQKESSLTDQEFYSRENSLLLLKKYFPREAV